MSEEKGRVESNEQKINLFGKNYKWKKLVCDSGNLFESFIEILRIVEPNTPAVKGLITRDPVNYRCYVACNENENIAAIGIGCYLSKTNVFHIEDFALCESFRKQGFAKKIYNLWRDFIAIEWPETQKAGSKTSIEVYFENIKPWEIIMGVEIIKVDIPAIYIDQNRPIVFMGKNIQYQSTEVYHEWQDYQKKFYHALLSE